MSVGFNQENDAWDRLETIEEPHRLPYQLSSTCSPDSLVIFHPDRSEERIVLELPSAHGILDLIDVR